MRSENAWNHGPSGRVNRQGRQTDCWTRVLLRSEVWSKRKKGKNCLHVFLQFHPVVRFKGGELGLMTLGIQPGEYNGRRED